MKIGEKILSCGENNPGSAVLCLSISIFTYFFTSSKPNIFYHISDLGMPICLLSQREILQIQNMVYFYCKFRSIHAKGPRGCPDKFREKWVSHFVTLQLNWHKHQRDPKFCPLPELWRKKIVQFWWQFRKWTQIKR